MKAQGTTSTGVAPANAVTAQTIETEATKPLGEADYRKLDRAVVSAFTGVEKAFDRAATAIIAAHDAELHLHTVNEATGKPFGSFAAYAKDRAASFPVLSKSLSKALMVTLHEHGLSLRAIAAVTNVSSQATVKNVVEAAATEVAKAAAESGDQAAAEQVANAEQVKASKLAKSLPGLLTRVQDSAVDMSDDELAATLLALNEAVGTLQGIAQHRIDTKSGANAQRAARAKAAARKSRDAEVAAIAEASKPKTLAENVGLAKPAPSVKPSDVAQRATA